MATGFRREKSGFCWEIYRKFIERTLTEIFLLYII